MLDRLFGSEQKSGHILRREKYYLSLLMFTANTVTVMLTGAKYKQFPLLKRITNIINNYFQQKSVLSNTSEVIDITFIKTVTLSSGSCDCASLM
jgi:hypothetical protein